MEIALTKKLKDQVKLNLHPSEKDLNPLFCGLQIGLMYMIEVPIICWSL